MKHLNSIEEIDKFIGQEYIKAQDLKRFVKIFSQIGKNEKNKRRLEIVASKTMKQTGFDNVYYPRLTTVKDGQVFYIALNDNNVYWFLKSRRDYCEKVI